MKAITSFGRPNFIYIGNATPWHAHPEYAGTPWADKDRLSKREHAVAKIHTLLFKLGALKNISEEEFFDIHKLCIKRLKRAKWATQHPKKVK